MEDGNARLQQTAKDTENLAKHCQKRCAKQAKKRQNGPTWPCVAKVMMKRSKRPQNTQRWHTPPFMTNFCDPGSPPPGAHCGVWQPLPPTGAGAVSAVPHRPCHRDIIPSPVCVCFLWSPRPSPAANQLWGELLHVGSLGPVRSQ